MADNRIVTIEAGKLGKIGWEKLRDNAIKFLATPVTLYVAFVMGNVQVDGVQALDFVPNQFVLGGIVVYIGSVVQDFFRKYTVDQKYIVEK